METIKFKPKQIDNINQGCRDLELIKGELAIAVKTGAVINPELLDTIAKCEARLQMHKNSEFYTRAFQQDKPVDEREVLDV